MSESGRPDRRASALEGRIGPISVSGLLDLLAREEATGRLDLHDGRQELAIWFLRGRPIHGRRPGAAEALDRLLLEGGVLSECQLAGAYLRTHLEPGKRLLDVLLEAGVLSERCIARLLQAQAREIVRCGLACRQGRFRFEAGCLPVAEGVLSEVGLEMLLLEPAEPGTIAPPTADRPPAGAGGAEGPGPDPGSPPAPPAS